MAKRTSKKRLIERGIRVAEVDMYNEDRIWARYSGDKVDIGEKLSLVIRTLSKTFPLTKSLRALSVGSGDEPQFRILEAAFRGGLYLLDIDEKMLEVVKERVRRQFIRGVITVRADYNKHLLAAVPAGKFLKGRLGGKRVQLITLHHSLYYAPESDWGALYDNLYGRILARKGAMHAVLMASDSGDRHTTTWLYNHFAGKFCGCRNDQDLLAFAKRLKSRPLFKKAGVISKTSRVRFFVDDFEKFMAVIWMILLYPEVHKYTLKQREEITEFIYDEFWARRRPLVQVQNYVAVYKGLGVKGLI
jgi:hypothetical protein